MDWRAFLKWRRLRRLWNVAVRAERGQTGAGEAVLRRYLDRHPTDAWGCGYLSQWFWVGEEHESALEVARKASDLREDFFTSGQLLRAMWTLERWDEVRASAEARASSHPEEAVPHLMLAEVADQAEDEGEFRSELDATLELVRHDQPIPDWAIYRLGLNFAAIRGCRQQAIEVLTRFAQIPPSGRYWTLSHLLLVVLQAPHSQWHADWSKRKVMDAEEWTESEYQAELANFRDHYRDTILAGDDSRDA